MTSKLYIGTNTKMYKSIAQTKAFISKLGRLTADIPREKMELFVIPSFTALESASPLCKQYGIHLGAQNMCWEDEGPYTGEISPLMLKEVGVEIVEIGHSERRHILGEDDEMANRKVLSALRHSLTPLLCIGETKKQRDLGIADEILRMQLMLGLRGTEEQHSHIYIAYEPVWAIGANGEPATPDYAESKHSVIRKTLVDILGEKGVSVPILYGGSVNPQNATDLMRMPHIGGLFIGRSAWEADSFDSIIRSVLPLVNLNMV